MTTYGVDISSNNDMPSLDGLDFVWIKATEGATYADPPYGGRRTFAKQAGLVVGAYLFYRTESTPQSQVSQFFSYAAIQPGDLVALDFENDSTWGQYSAQALANMAITTMQLLSAAYPYNRVVLYCNQDTYRRIIVPYTVPTGDGVWIAEPSGTPSIDWVFWQYGQNVVDLDYGNFDSKARLVQWANAKGKTSSGGVVSYSPGEFDMPMGLWEPGQNLTKHIVWPCGPDNSMLVSQAGFSMATGGGGAAANGHIWFIGTTTIRGDGQPVYIHEEDWDLKQDVRKEWAVPANTDQIHVTIASANFPIAWCLELFPK